MAQYSFTTLWQFEAPLERVWDEIKAIDQWPLWWKYVKSVDLVHAGNTNDIGRSHRIEWATALPYRFSFYSEVVDLEPYRRIEARAFGELVGKGVWSFETVEGYTVVRYDWMVNTTKKWMNVLAPIARPVFKWNHDRVMKSGYTGLKKKINRG